MSAKRHNVDGTLGDLCCVPEALLLWDQFTQAQQSPEAGGRCCVNGPALQTFALQRGFRNRPHLWDANKPKGRGRGGGGNSATSDWLYLSTVVMWWSAHRFHSHILSLFWRGSSKTKSESFSGVRNHGKWRLPEAGSRRLALGPTVWGMEHGVCRWLWTRTPSKDASRDGKMDGGKAVQPPT